MPEQTLDADIAIVGGGMVGVSSALACQERGLRVLLLDPGDPRRRASYGNAGAISRGSLFPVAGPGIRRNLLRYALNRDPGLRIDHAQLWRILPWLTRFMRAASVEGWRRAAAALDPLVGAAYAEQVRLAEQAGVRHLITREGWLKLFRQEQGFAGSALEREILAAYGVAVTMLDAGEVRDLEPALTRPFARGMLFPETGHVRNPGALVAALTELFCARGGRWETATVAGLAPSGAGWTLNGEGRTWHAAQVVLATGGWANQLTRALGYRLPLAVERGYHRHIRQAEGQPPLGRTVYDVAGGYVLAPMEAGIRVLSGVELAPRDAPPDTRQLEACIRAARETLALGEPVEAEAWAGSRPSTPDGLPVIGPAPQHKGLWFAFGHGHIGLSTGPVTGQIIADLVTGRTPDIPVAPFAATRF